MGVPREQGVGETRGSGDNRAARWASRKTGPSGTPVTALGEGRVVVSATLSPI